ncbi:MAG: SurA N-terminal domain-containing protein [Bacteroidaceae bacterium]|nr:SurA N-terminal domain-containing protein [Bacteroidaceae bacterium]
MAVLGKIRNRSLLLICIIGFALFAFIAEELFRSCESTRNEASQRVGEVLGEKLSVQDFNIIVDEYTTAMKVMQQRDDFSADELSQIRDMAWQNYVSQKVLENECKTLGLTVTDKELQTTLSEGTHPMLSQTPFVNQQTGRFDVNLLKEFLSNFKKVQGTNPQMAEQMKPVYDYWQFIEKTLRNQLLQQKYQVLLGGCMLSNSISEKALFEAENNEATIQLASFSYSSLNDKDVKVEDADLKAKYDELKDGFRRYQETRNIQYVDVQVMPSSADINALNKEMAGYKADLEGGKDAAEVVRKSGSLVTYNGLAKLKSAYPADIAALIDSLAVGSTSANKENKRDNTMNVVKLIGKVQLPDSVTFRAIQIADADAAVAQKKADSVVTALNGGADFETLAKKYGQPGTEQTITSAQYQSTPSVDQDTKAYLEALLKGTEGEVNNLKLSAGHLVIKVVAKKAFKDMYDVAVVKKPIQFSKETNTKEFNKFSEYVAKSKSLDDLKKNAKQYEYEVKPLNDIVTTVHNVANVHSTSEVLKWIFDKDTSVGDVSKLYECGDNGDHFMVVVLDKINEEGYASLDDANVKNFIKSLALNDKKAAKLMEKASKCKSVADAEKAGAKVSEVKQITFASPAFITETGSPEPALSGAVTATAKGKMGKSAVKGNAGVYVFQVTDKTAVSNKMDSKAMAQKLQQKALMSAQGFMQELMLKADIKDNRYIFF